MKYGIREICDVVLRAKSKQTIGNMTFHRDMPVLYFDSLKTSSVEGAATTVYATGGTGNTRLIAWEGEKTVTFTMEDALISPVSLAVLSGAGVIDKTEGAMTNTEHGTETAEIQIKEVTSTEDSSKKTYKVCGIKHKPYINPDQDFYMYIIPLDRHGDMNGQPVRVDVLPETLPEGALIKDEDVYTLDLTTFSALVKEDNVYAEIDADIEAESLEEATKGIEKIQSGDLVMIDYYFQNTSNVVTEIDIDAENFAGNYYLEASTLWRNKAGKDIAAEFIIPNCKIQSNFTFSMAASGDPSTFTFTMDAFPDYTKYNKSKKVLCAIRLVEEDSVTDDLHYGRKIQGKQYTEPKTSEQPVVNAGTYSWRDKLNTSAE